MPPTKRKAIASVYDPIGYIQHVVIRLKLMFQIICSIKIGWDDYIGDGLNVKCAKMISDLENFSEVTIRRCYFRFDVKDPIKYLYLHGFSDSSEEAYAACVYIKAVSRCNNVKINLVAAKSRLVPIKKEFTIPRLELLGNFILSKLIAVVYEVLSQEIEIGIEQFCWTDSTITLSWIRGENLEFKPFVENRLRIIRRNVNSKLWNHCRSSENPADIITRFNSCNLNDNDTWWHGPPFLKAITEQNLFNQRGKPRTCNTNVLEDENLSHVNLHSKETHDELKSKEGITLIVKNHQTDNIQQTIDIDRYSNLYKLYRITALVFRMIHNIQTKDKKEKLLYNYVTLKELRKAKTIWIKGNQSHLREHERYDELKNQLNLYEDDENIIRSQGRLKYTDLPYNTKDPIMLHRDHRLASNRTS